MYFVHLLIRHARHNTFFEATFLVSWVIDDTHYFAEEEDCENNCDCDTDSLTDLMLNNMSEEDLQENVNGDENLNNTLNNLAEGKHLRLFCIFREWL